MTEPYVDPEVPAEQPIEGEDTVPGGGDVDPAVAGGGGGPKRPTSPDQE